MISVNSPFYLDRDRLSRWDVDIAIRKWRRHEFKFTEVFLLGTLRGNAVEFVPIKYETCWCTIGRDGIQCEAGWRPIKQN